VEHVTGLPIHYFVSIDFSGFKRIVDILGGVVVNVQFTFDDYYYPIKGMEDDSCGRTEEDVEALSATMSGELLERQFECRFEHLHFDKGVQTMEGETALKFVRSRHSSVGGSDFGRAVRQQAFIAGFKDQLVSLKSISKIISLITEAARNISTDIDIRSAIELAQKQEVLGDFTITSISLSTENVLKEGIWSDGQYILTSVDGTQDYLVVREYIKKKLEKMSLATPTPKPDSGKITN
jgi:anionic cell wall polymer biosynthesis LytR-Cps2A-Psr (LCP) family protein